MDYLHMIGRLLKKDVFEEVVRFRNVPHFFIERMPSGKTDVRSKDASFLKDIRWFENSSVQVDF